MSEMLTGQRLVPLEGLAGCFPWPAALFALCFLEHCPTQVGGPHPGGCAQPFPAEPQDTLHLPGSFPRGFSVPCLIWGQWSVWQHDRD